MYLHVITEHTTLHHKALACLILMENATSADERKQFATKYASFMQQLCSKTIEKAFEDCNDKELHPHMANVITNCLNEQEAYNTKAMKIVEEVS